MGRFNHKKCRHPRCPPTIIPRSEVELQCELNVPLSLRRVDLPHHSRSQGKSGGTTRKVQYWMVEEVDEISLELQCHILGNVKVLVNTQIDVGVSWAPERTDPAVAVRAGSRLAKGTWV